MRNFFPNYQGGASSRAGYAYCGMCKQGAPNAGGVGSNSIPPRDIRFQYNINQGFALEFGELYMRIKSDGAYIVETGVTITGATNANPLVVTAAAHGYSNGDWVYIAGMGGMTQLNGLTWVVTNVTTNTFHLTDLFGNVVDSTLFGVFTSGGTSARIYTVVSPYHEVDLPYLKFTQSANTMSLCLVNQTTGAEYATYDLTRVSNTDWVFTATTFGALISAPTGMAVTAESSTTVSTYYSYVVTAVNSAGDESIASAAAGVENNDISIYAGSNVITWSAVAGAVSYNVYKATPTYNIPVPAGVLYGFMQASIGTSAVDTNISADFTSVPPVHTNPFARGVIEDITVTAPGTGFSQSTIGYSITTSTGSGFVGTPIVTNGQFSGFAIQNGGQLYQPTDTIAITSGNAAATGTYTFSANPTNGHTIILNGVTWTFVTSGATGTQTNIGANTAVTLSTLANDLGISANTSINVASYSASATVLTIRYKTTGTAGNSYTLAAGTYGGSVSGATLSGGVNGTDLGAKAVLVVGPATGTYPGVVAYFQQRRGYGYTLDEPDTYNFSKPGLYTNMDSATPVSDGDAIQGTPWAQQINGIQWMIPMPNGLIVLTGNGGWLLNGFNGAALTPSSQQAIQQANVGCSALVPPILINSDILYVQSKNSVVRDLTYNFFTNIYMGEDKTILANHLFFNHTLIQWAYAEEPYKIIWAVRDDGVLLSLTWLKEQDIWGWARHDTNGLFVGVCTVTEPPVDAIYVIVKRYINGQFVYYAERQDNRLWQTVEDSFCVDAGLSYPQPQPAATLTPAAANGTSNISATNVISGGTGYTSPTATAIDATGLGSGATFTVTVSGGVITAVTPVTQGTKYVPGQTSIVVTDATGSGAVIAPVITNNVVFTASASVFSSGNVGSVIRIGGGKATITAYTSGTQITANITQPITAVLQDNVTGALQPIPAVSGTWTMTAPVSTVTGLNHLNGQTVAILADGSVVSNQVVANNSIILPQAASSITIGLPYVCQLQTLYLDPAAQTTTQSKRKTISSVAVRVENTRGISVGSNQVDASTQPDGTNQTWVNMIQVKETNALVNAGQSIPLFTGDYFVNIPSNWSTDGQIAIQQTYPLPCNALAVISYYNVGDSNG